MKIRFIKKQRETDTIWSFFFEPESELSWKPGQYLYCILKHQNQDSRGDRRYFTIASAPHEHVIMITTRYLADKSSSFKRALFNLEKDNLLDTYPPDGSFTADDLSGSYLCVAGGIGITPFRSWFSAFDYRGEFPDLSLVYGNQSSDPVFMEEFGKYAKKFPKFKIHPCLAPETITDEFIRSHVHDYRNRQAYISGPEPMVKNINTVLQTMGINKKSIKTDYFPGYTD